MQDPTPELVVIDASGHERGRAVLPSEGGATAVAFAGDASLVAVACDLPKQCLAVFSLPTVCIWQSHKQATTLHMLRT
jgi:hypothetical protein